MTDSAEKLLPLLPCPFCGEEVEDVGAGNILHKKRGLGFFANCPISHIGVGTKAWNRRAHLSDHPVTGQGDANGGWISVADRLPEAFLYDDTQCFIGGMKVDPLYRSKSALVAIGTHGVGVDVIERIGDSKPFWSAFGSRVTHWMEMPPLPARTNDRRQRDG